LNPVTGPFEWLTFVILIFIGMVFLIVAVGIWTFLRALLGGGARKDILHR
jgi:hypothetical protein